MARRPTHPMPDEIRSALEAAGVMEDYLARPFYQRNDWLGWIARAKRHETRQRRLDQMLEELDRGGLYMGMQHRPSRKDPETDEPRPG